MVVPEGRQGLEKKRSAKDSLIYSDRHCDKRAPNDFF
jgi:hypothetical protein